MHNFVENVDNFSRNKNEKSVSYATGIIPDIQYTQSKAGSLPSVKIIESAITSVSMSLKMHFNEGSISSKKVHFVDNSY